MSNDLEITSSILDLMREAYSDAQDSFVLLEVSEHFHARKVLKKLTKIAELLYEAVRKTIPANVEEARSKLQTFALLNLRYLCQVRFKEINWLRRRSKFIWWLLFLRKPFKREDINVLLQNAGKEYDVGRDPEQEFDIRSESLRKCFADLQEAMSLIRPHKFYNHLFFFILEGIFALIGALLAVVFLG